jgi:predicted ATP-dependent endonuclease of OLD family
MKLIWARIIDFRSIIDSGKFHVDPRITVLAGKNESGKTTVLDAIKKAIDDKFVGDDRPLHIDGEGSPEVHLGFLLDRGEVERIFGRGTKFTEPYEVCLKRYMDYADDYDGSAYLQATKTLATRVVELRNEIQALLFICFDILKQPCPEINEDDTLFLQRRAIESAKAQIKAYVESVEDPAPIFPEAIAKVEKLQKDLATIAEVYNGIHRKFKLEMPSVVSFSSFEDLLPDTITLDDIDGSEITKRFFKLANTDPNSLLSETGAQRRQRTTDRVSATVTGNFKEYYTQSNIQIKVKLDGPEIQFFIYDAEVDTPYLPRQRSKGFQWFLSFYLTLNAEGSKKTIILIDEPGLFLHAKAQSDILQVLESISKDSQILFSTHSPYLIDPSKLDRLRLVHKDEASYTTIENKFYKGADKDTMTPVITAIGLDITKDIGFSRRHNVLTEGISDYFYIQAIKRYLGDEYPLKDTTFFIPCIGSDQTLNIASLMEGWEIPYKILYDNDKAGINAANKARKLLGLPDDKIVFTLDEKDSAIEDLFTNEDFDKFILNELQESSFKNSQRVKGQDKVLLSKKFCTLVSEKCDAVQLSEATKENFLNLFRRLQL